MYGKHHAAMYSGSMVGSGAVVFAVWGYVIAHLRHSDNSVELNPRIVATILGEPVEKIEEAIERLCSPDKHSRSPEHEGRRLVLEAPFLYHVVNAAKYNSLKDEDARREYMRLYMKSKRSKQALTSVNTGKEKLTHAEADANATVKTTTSTTVEQIYGAYPKKVGKKQALFEIALLIKNGVDPGHLLKRTQVFAASPKARTQFVLDPERFFKKQRYDDDERDWQRTDDAGSKCAAKQSPGRTAQLAKLFADAEANAEPEISGNATHFVGPDNEADICACEPNSAEADEVFESGV